MKLKGLRQKIELKFSHFRIKIGHPVCFLRYFKNRKLRLVDLEKVHLLEQNKNKVRRYIHQYRLTELIEYEECSACLIGKSGTGKGGKYFYYGHLHRCKIETIPALQVEEAIIGRLKDLSADRKLIAELAKTTAATTQASNVHKKSLMAAKGQERRKLDQRLKIFMRLLQVKPTKPYV